MARTEEAAFPRLTSAELALVRPLTKPCYYADAFRPVNRTSISTLSNPARWRFARFEQALAHALAGGKVLLDFADAR